MVVQAKVVAIPPARGQHHMHLFVFTDEMKRNERLAQYFIRV